METPPTPSQHRIPGQCVSFQCQHDPDLDVTENEEDLESEETAEETSTGREAGLRIAIADYLNRQHRNGMAKGVKR